MQSAASATFVHRPELEPTDTAQRESVAMSQSSRPRSGAAEVDLAYAGPALLPGMVYQLRVTLAARAQRRVDAELDVRSSAGAFEYRSE